MGNRLDKMYNEDKEIILDKIKEIIIDEFRYSKDRMEEFVKTQPYEVLCKKCGDSLTITKRDVDYEDDISVIIEPCEACMEESRLEGLAEGYENGLRDAEDD